jgi:NAD(P)-dependent dehydrogenase (short-subunit alcohol dehydrogenase family)
MGARLQGRTALVTGSTEGIGAAIAQAFAAEGAFVVLSGRNEDRGQALMRAMLDAGQHADFLAADLGDGVGELTKLVDRAVQAAGGRLDILVNNAAQFTGTTTAETTEQVIDRLFAVNVRAPMLLTGLIGPGMAARGTGRIINIGSLGGLLGSGSSPLFNATKAALHSLTKSWADEYGPFGVRVNTIAPGPTLTPALVPYQEAIAPMIAATPSRRASTPEEVAAAAAFLASDGASNVNGVTLSVDGGLAAV